MYCVVICAIKFNSLTTGHFLLFHSSVAVQQISCTNRYSAEMRTDGYHDFFSCFSNEGKLNILSESDYSIAQRQGRERSRFMVE